MGFGGGPMEGVGEGEERGDVGNGEFGYQRFLFRFSFFLSLCFLVDGWVDGRHLRCGEDV